MTPVLWSGSGPVATLTLNRPERRNAIDAALSDALRDAVDRLENTPHLRAGILTGTGPVFCAGMDLAAFLGGEAEAILFGPGRIGGLASRIRTKPLIAAVNGPALAGGFELMLACDIAIATPDARFGLPEPGIGLIAGAGGALLLADRIPRAVAMQMLLTGDPIGAQEALRLGLVTALHPLPDLIPKATRIAERIARNSPTAIAETLATAHSPADWPATDAALRRMMAHDDAREGPRAFLEKRPPRW